MPYEKRTFTQDEIKYLTLLSNTYPTVQQVCTELINLKAILNLPKGTEHFMSDLHGEYAAFYHILNNGSGVIREKVNRLFGEEKDEQWRSDFCTLIYYPEQKLSMIREEGKNTEAWYEETLYRLIDLCKLLSSKYTRQKVREALPAEYSYIIDELLHAQPDEDDNQLVYHRKIIETIIGIQNSDDFIIALASLVKRLAVDRLHIVGDIFDRGPRADSIVDMLMQYHSVDIEWGNHDILWMGAAAGSRACMMTVVRNSVAYHNLATLENGYGVSIRPLSDFAGRAYPECDSPHKALLKAVSVILFKLEGQVIRRHPEYNMDSRMLLEQMDLACGTVTIDGKVYPLKDTVFPTINWADPYALSEEEERIMHGLARAFRGSERLQRHTRFLYERGSMYRIYNQNLLFHGCIPMDENGDLAVVTHQEKRMRGKEYMDYCDRKARRAYLTEISEEERQDCQDFMWYLWCGKESPLFGRSKMTTFERMLVEDESSWTEEKNPYYRHYQSEAACVRILENFGLTSPYSHIINGHVPVRAIEGESPVKANGRLIVIDGGFCKAYHSRTGIAGYTLIYNSHGMRIMSHQAFENTKAAILENRDIESSSEVFETELSRVMVSDTDHGNKLSNRIYDLTLLLNAYRQGVLTPKFSRRQDISLRYPGDEQDLMKELRERSRSL